MNDDFHTCQKCDFEWHSKDGLSCPICSRKMCVEQKEERDNEGMFGSGSGRKRLKLYYQAIGLTALILFLYAIFRL